VDRYGNQNGSGKTLSSDIPSCPDGYSSDGFKQIEGFPGYAVSFDGKAWSCMNARWGYRIKWKEIAIHPCPDGYRAAALRDRESKKTFKKRVCWLVLETFVGPRPEKFDACHNDGTRNNDSLSNLRWDSRKANVEDARIHGRLLLGERAPNSILTEEKVRNIRNMYQRGVYGYKRIAKDFDIPFSTVVGIITRRRWKHI
jgi:hypothetical protein